MEAVHDERVKDSPLRGRVKVLDADYLYLTTTRECHYAGFTPVANIFIPRTSKESRARLPLTGRKWIQLPGV